MTESTGWHMRYSLLPIVAAHLLAFVLVVLWPVWDDRQLRSLRAHPSGPARLAYYRQLTLLLWIAAGVACWSDGIGSLLTLGRIGIDSTWLHEHLWIWYVLATLVGLAVLVQLVWPVIQVSVKYRDREFLEPKQFLPLRFFLPHSAMERRWFAVLSLTAGFTEELLFRGFLLRYFHSSPLHLPLVWAVAIAALIFGIHHLYQGLSGVISTTITGLIFTAMLLVTGSLWMAMACHAAIDMSLLLYWRPKPDAEVK
jgi:uncharacterized protein